MCLDRISNAPNLCDTCVKLKTKCTKDYKSPQPNFIMHHCIPLSPEHAHTQSRYPSLPFLSSPVPPPSSSRIITNTVTNTKRSQIRLKQRKAQQAGAKAYRVLAVSVCSVLVWLYRVLAASVCSVLVWIYRVLSVSVCSALVWLYRAHEVSVCSVLVWLYRAHAVSVSSVLIWYRVATVHTAMERRSRVPQWKYFCQTSGRFTLTAVSHHIHH